MIFFLIFPILWCNHVIPSYIQNKQNYHLTRNKRFVKVVFNYLLIFRDLSSNFLINLNDQAIPYTTPSLPHHIQLVGILLGILYLTLYECSFIINFIFIASWWDILTHFSIVFKLNLTTTSCAYRLYDEAFLHPNELKNQATIDNHVTLSSVVNFDCLQVHWCWSHLKQDQ